MPLARPPSIPEPALGSGLRTLPQPQRALTLMFSLPPCLQRTHSLNYEGPRASHHPVLTRRTGEYTPASQQPNGSCEEGPARARCDVKHLQFCELALTWALTRLCSSAPCGSWSLDSLGMTHFLMGNYEDASLAFTQAMATGRGDARYANNRYAVSRSVLILH